MTGPPRAKLFEPDLTVRVAVDIGERRVDLGVGVADAQRVQQAAELGFFNRAVAITVHALEAISQRIGAHVRTLRRFLAPSNCACLLLVGALASCRNTAEPPINTRERASASAPSARPEPHAAGMQGASSHSSTAASYTPPAPLTPGSTSPSAPDPRPLPPLTGKWLEWHGDAEQTLVVMPPLGAVTPRRLIVGVHGAGDRPDWSCGGWRLASQVSSFVVCPQGAPMTRETFGWASETQLSERLNAALAVAQARYASYIDDAPFIYAGFSQGATLAERFLRRNAARFPIAILAEGGYATARSPAFAKAFYAAGGRRVVLVCGGATCFRSASGSKKVLEAAGLQVLVVGDPKAGHNLNEPMQRALQGAWPEIAAPLPAR